MKIAKVGSRFGQIFHLSVWLEIVFCLLLTEYEFRKNIFSGHLYGSEYVDVFGVYLESPWVCLKIVVNDCPGN